MNYKTHIIFGLILNVIVFTLLYLNGWVISLFSLPILFIISIFYSQLPDIDQQSSKIRYVITIIFCLVSLYFLFVGSLANSVAVITGLIFIWTMKYIKLFKHRHITHTSLANLAFSVPLYAYSLEAMIVGLIAYQSHIIADSRIFKAVFG